MALSEARGERGGQTRLQTLSRNSKLKTEQHQTIYSKARSVSQERRCKRGGGYRMQAK